MSEIGRWWADPKRARWALGVVDDSDVKMGVGTAILGYHGLAAGVLTPLADGTLADGRQIIAALDAIDLEPVATAVTKATAPVMGEAAERYGQVWAEQLHERAVEAALGLYGSLTTAGMPSPLALDRVVAVAGVPTEAIGKAWGTLREARTAPRVLADVADRTLMDYAARRGELEAGAVEEIAKASAFKEANHPRHSDGRFRSKSGAKEVDPASARKERRLRRMKRLTAQQTALAQQQAAAPAQPRAGSQMRQMLAPLNPVVQEETKTERPPYRTLTGSPFAEVLARRDMYRSYRDAIEQGARITEVATPLIYDDERADALLNQKFAVTGNEHLMDAKEGVYFPVTREEAQILLERAKEGSDEFSIGGFQRLTGTHLAGYTLGSLMSDYTHQAHTMGMTHDDVVLLRVRGVVPLATLDDSVTDLEDGRIDFVRMPDSAKMQLGTDWEYFQQSDGFQYDDEVQIEIPAPKFAWSDQDTSEKLFPIIDLEFPSQNMADYPLTRTERPQPKRSSTAKALGAGVPTEEFVKANAFREADVVRDPQGRFSTEGRKVEPEADDRRARRERRLRRQRMLASQLQGQQAMAPAAPPARQALAPLNAQVEQRTVIPARPEYRMAPDWAPYIRRAADALTQPDADTDSLAGLRAVRFDANKMDAFYAVTGMNPFGEAVSAADMLGFVGVGFSDASRQEILNDLIDAKAVGTSEHMVDMAGFNAVHGVTSTPATERTRVAGRDQMYSDELAAHAQAEMWTDIQNSKLVGDQMWMPWVEQMDSIDGPVYLPRATIMGSAPQAGFIFGDEDAMEAMYAGYDVDFEPLETSSLRALVMESGLNTTYNPTEFPDAPIQAVRVKLRENPRMEER